MHKNLLDFSGPGVFFLYLVNHVIPATTPAIIWLGALASLAWYGVRFYDRFVKRGPSSDEE